MAHITANFLAESPLSSKAREALGDAFDQGWGDPRKLAHSAARARILQDQAIASLAQNLGIRPDELEILGEPALGHFYAIGGLLQPADTLVYSSVDRKEVYAIAQGLSDCAQIGVDHSGRILRPELERVASTRGVFALQVANGETGVIQDVNELIESAGALRIAADYSAAGPGVGLPRRWDTAFFEARSWQGPQGIGILAIHTAANWKNPIAHLGKTRTPQSASLPLMIATAVALEEWLLDAEEESARLRAINHKLRIRVSSAVENCDIAGNLDQSLPHIASFSFLYVEGEELLRRLELSGFAVDSGSACTADDLQPSHVLAAMEVLTHGNIRITLHRDSTAAQVMALADAIEWAVTELRAR